MARLYIVSIPSHEVETVVTADRVATLIVGHDNRRHRETLLDQLARVSPGETAYLTGGISVQVIGHGDEEDEPSAG